MVFVQFGAGRHSQRVAEVVAPRADGLGWFVAGGGPWEDSAPHSKKDSLYPLTFLVLNGVHLRRLWITSFSKRVLSTCGCYGRHTLDAIWDVVGALLVGHILEGTTWANPSRGTTGDESTKAVG